MNRYQLALGRKEPIIHDPIGSIIVTFHVSGGYTRAEFEVPANVVDSMPADQLGRIVMAIGANRLRERLGRDVTDELKGLHETELEPTSDGGLHVKIHVRTRDATHDRDGGNVYGTPTPIDQWDGGMPPRIQMEHRPPQAVAQMRGMWNQRLAREANTPSTFAQLGEPGGQTRSRPREVITFGPNGQTRTTRPNYAARAVTE